MKRRIDGAGRSSEAWAPLNSGWNATTVEQLVELTVHAAIGVSQRQGKESCGGESPVEMLKLDEEPAVPLATLMEPPIVRMMEPGGKAQRPRI